MGLSSHYNKNTHLKKNFALVFNPERGHSFVPVFREHNNHVMQT